MGKEKKKDSKKGEKSLAPPAPPARDPSFDLASSFQNVLPPANQVDEPLAAQLVSKEEEKETELPSALEPIVYEEPTLTQLIVESYEGEKVHGLYEGEGTAHFQGGNVYKGMFSEGLMHGQGMYTWADGVQFEGNFVKNLQMHHGSYTWPDGSTYEGEVKNGIRHGYGVYNCGTHPVSYIGQWVEGKRHGKGRIHYNKEDSSWYEGDFVNNVKSGWGIRRYKSGNMYEGQWERDMRHGEGRMRWLTTNQEYTGKWVNGIQHGYGTHAWYLKRIPGTQYPLRNEYVGDFVCGDRHGRGKFFFASGAMYDGEWVYNKKHGMGKLVFKDGHAYEGEFIDDHIAEYPTFQVDTMNAQDLSSIRMKSRYGNESIKVVDGTGGSSLLEPNIEIDISPLLAMFPEKDKEEEIKQTEFAVVRHISELRRIYAFYSSLGYDRSLDNTFLMTKLQFWRFLKDCRFHHCNLTLAEMDRILNDKALLEEIHFPSETLLLRMFLTYLVYLSFHIYHKEFNNTSPCLFKCFSKLMVENITPNACQIKGTLFSNRQQTVYAIHYMDKCWEIFRFFCRPSPVDPHEPTMKMRHFIWMLKDLRLISKQLTATKIVDILAKDSPRVRDGEDTNLEYELVFLEFFDALLDCAPLYVTDEMLKERAEEASRSESSCTDRTGVSPLPQEMSPGQSVQTRSTSSGEESHETPDVGTIHVSDKTSASKIVHFVEVSKTKKSEKGKAKDGKKEDKASRHGAKSPNKEKPSSPQTAAPNVTFTPMVEDKEEAFARTRPSSKMEHEAFLSAPLKELADKLQNAKNNQKDKLSLWMSQLYIFFVSKFFNSYKCLQVVQETILDNRVRETELLALKKIQEEEEEAKLNAMREAEEARKLEEAAAEKAAALELEESLCKEMEEGSIPLVSPSKEESPVLQQVPPSSKTTAAGKKKKKA